ncbi:MAG TPA: ATP synthase F1 subunit delta [Bryobacteraceae bacterium]|nr:ATP synthase F1 subunit delta [Bryobacteraceae bacterium]
MTSSALASRYASALVDVATDPKSGVDPHKVLGELRAFTEVLAGSAELRNALVSPAVPPARKRAVVGRIGEKLGMSRVARNFLFVLTDHRRISALAEVVDAFDLLLDDRLGFTRAEISSARELDQHQRDAVSRELERITGRKVRLRFGTDRELVGGMVARIGSTVYDGSVRGQLQALGKRLAAE